MRFALLSEDQAAETVTIRWNDAFGALPPSLCRVRSVMKRLRAWSCVPSSASAVSRQAVAAAQVRLRGRASVEVAGRDETPEHHKRHLLNLARSADAWTRVSAGRLVSEAECLIATVGVRSLALRALVDGWHPQQHLASLSVPFIAFAAIPSTAVALYVQAALLKDVSPTRVALLFALEPVFTAVYSRFMLGEEVNATQLFGCLLVLTGMPVTELLPHLLPCAPRSPLRFPCPSGRTPATEHTQQECRGAYQVILSAKSERTDPKPSKNR